MPEGRETWRWFREPTFDESSDGIEGLATPTSVTRHRSLQSEEFLPGACLAVWPMSFPVHLVRCHVETRTKSGPTDLDEVEEVSPRVPVLGVAFTRRGETRWGFRAREPARIVIRKICVFCLGSFDSRNIGNQFFSKFLGRIGFVGCFTGWANFQSARHSESQHFPEPRRLLSGGATNFPSPMRQFLQEGWRGLDVLDKPRRGGKGHYLPNVPNPRRDTSIWLRIFLYFPLLVLKGIYFYWTYFFFQGT